MSDDLIEIDEKNNIKEVPKLKRIDKEKNRCSSCHRLRVIKNKELNLCSICDQAKRYWESKSDVKKTEDKIIDDVVEDNNTDNEVEDKIETETYLCDYCSSKVIYGQRQCKKCNTYLDWRNTKIADDNNYLICGECGVILNKNDTKCFNCGG